MPDRNNDALKLPSIRRAAIGGHHDSPQFPLAIDVDACGEFLPRQPSGRRKFRPVDTALQALGTSCSALRRKRTQRLTRAPHADLGLYLYSFQDFLFNTAGRAYLRSASIYAHASCKVWGSAIRPRSVTCVCRHLMAVGSALHLHAIFRLGIQFHLGRMSIAE
ncbi:hypothetical protein FV194_17810 [Pseudomonas aeruginosa]|nr:hypothetical protein [Pseudomonas aeruginosa]OWK91877.1 hypothetical protein L999_025525 [Pseudomonas aeruginosa 148]MUL53576.1 hypothetical protein [Pseudomonas aeruginosa]ORE44409.1 hypothetical protein BKN49_16295 [Pseudomonas aeruginosa]RRQ66100.1 hypothetical protein CR937_24725 [Pseudomonas aeruginosa]